MSKRKLAVLVFSSKGILAVEPTVRGFLTTSLKFVRLQAKLQQKIRKPGIPIGIGIQLPYGDGFKWKIIEWLVPWKADKKIVEPAHDHLSLLNADMFKK